jgi:50S ribosomal protein L16 3-hydroxylase
MRVWAHGRDFRRSYTVAPPSVARIASDAYNPLMTRSNTPPIEVPATKKQRLGMPPARFLRDYWQKRPLLIRGAHAGFATPVTPNDLAGVAGEDMALSRLVAYARRADRFTLRSGPFSAADFAALPKRDWTLLVQDCDKWFDEVAQFRDTFDFVPSWRVDDVMISYAVDGGSVGPHLDQYDVFLLQASGRRRWQISTDPRAPRAFRANAQLKLLERFSPTHDFVLDTGDMLYLPPGVPHHGVAVGECTTWSIGMRAPAAAELLADYAGFVAEQLGDDWRYADPELRVPGDAAEIDAGAVATVVKLLEAAGKADPARVRDWFGRFITSYRSAHLPMRRARPLDAAQLAARLARGAVLLRSPWSRHAWRRDGRRAIAYLGGDAFPRRLGVTAPFSSAELSSLAAADQAVLLELVNTGHYALARTP